ncbi:hypothetical protein [Pontibacillus marinus]|uniref:Flavoprotein n=1 Tax=Pontibacillus marinus BH030004 = DSM 16465 TaxID=1385511 RepID=A0A0A5G8W0_9BACI|nr:hypothetical protein [Pontibacillus marinus]KGX89576.1 flavoprotein [Pontibacillus marinus BH030004 = DSM 16465]
MVAQVKTDFHSFLDEYLSNWKQGNTDYMREVISKELQAREIREGEAVDFGYEESVQGWAGAFDYFADQDMEWVLTPQSIISLKEDEKMAIVRAAPIIEGKLVPSSNLFFNTFKQDSATNEWKLVRSYVETGVPN